MLYSAYIVNKTSSKEWLSNIDLYASNTLLTGVESLTKAATENTPMMEHMVSPTGLGNAMDIYHEK